MRWGTTASSSHNRSRRDEKKESPHTHTHIHIHIHTIGRRRAADRWKHNQDFLICYTLLKSWWVRVEEAGESYTYAGGFRECLDGVTEYGWHEITYSSWCDHGSLFDCLQVDAFVEDDKLLDFVKFSESLQGKMVSASIKVCMPDLSGFSKDPFKNVTVFNEIKFLLSLIGSRTQRQMSYFKIYFRFES